MKNNSRFVVIQDLKDLDTLNPEGQKGAVAALISECAATLNQPPGDLVGLNFRDFLKDAFGVRGANKVLLLVHQFGGLNALKTAYFPRAVTSTLAERVEVAETARVNRKYENCEAYNEFFFNRFKKSVIEAYKQYPVKVTPFKATRPDGKNEAIRELNVVLSDLHLQSLVKRAETGKEYGATEEARRLASIAFQVANYKLDHRKSTDLNVLMLGDIIQNQLHDPRTGSTLTEQFQAAVYLLTQVLGYWASAFRRVTVYCSTGNHGRNIGRHKTRAVFEKWDSIETMIYTALQASLKGVAPNLSFVIPQTPWIEYETCGHPVYATHGDTVFNPGNPGKTVDVQKLENQVNKTNVSRQKPFDIFVAGHVHRALQVFLDSGVTVFTNAPLCPPDGFANSIGVYDTQCGQWMWESTKKFPVGDTRLMKVGATEDADATLDRIIKPYRTFGVIADIPRFKKK